ncbi:MAG: hypothetical protein LUG47_01815 [Clostridiales bacterium]|nr:hypothetical protein [Clostridiales bacterium]
MNKTWSAYQKAIKRGLYCGRKVKKRLLAELDGMAAPLLAENPAPTREELETALGTPEAVSASLMEGVSQQERATYRRNRLLLRIGLVVFVLALVIFTLWLVYMYSIPIEVVETTYVYYD